jgi:hypothetical protein
VQSPGFYPHTTKTKQILKSEILESKNMKIFNTSLCRKELPFLEKLASKVGP